jgi:glycosyltransferase involved in cell wall biosynthesis
MKGMGITMEYAGKVLMLVENSLPWDQRVYREAQTLHKSGYKVTVISLKRKGQTRREILNGVIVYRIPPFELFEKKASEKKGIFSRIFAQVKSFIGYFIEYFYFSFMCFFLSFYVLIREGFDVIHAHNPPDTLFFIGAFYRVFGKKFVFDHHDLSPELYLSRFNCEKNFIYKVLEIFEILSIKCSNVTIATNESYKSIEIKRGGIKPENVFIVRNGPDLGRVRIVPKDQNLVNMGKSIIAYCGVMGPQDGVDYLLRAIRILAYDIGRTDFLCIIIGRGDAFEDLKKLAEELKIQEFVQFTGFIPDADMYRYMSTADICVDPDPSSPLNDVSTWIKIMEYMALGKPIVSFDLKETRFSARDSAIYVEPNNEKEFAKAIVKLMDNPDMRNKLGEFGRERIMNELNWDIVGKNLILAYDHLFNKKIGAQSVIEKKPV